MAAITVTPRKISATWDRGAVILDFIAGATVNIGDCVYMDDNNYVQQVVGTTLKGAHSFGIVVGSPNQYAETAIPSGASCAVCVHGPVYGFDNPAYIDGQLIYVSKTVAGGMDTAAPSGGVYDFVVGNAQGADCIFVRPGQSAPASTA